MYQEAGVDIEKKIAGLLCSAIVSDTLLFRSPTCTPVDEMAARSLAAIAGLDIEKYAMEMFGAVSYTHLSPAWYRLMHTCPRAPI